MICDLLLTRDPEAGMKRRKMCIYFPWQDSHVYSVSISLLPAWAPFGAVTLVRSLVIKKREKQTKNKKKIGWWCSWRHWYRLQDTKSQRSRLCSCDFQMSNFDKMENCCASFFFFFFSFSPRRPVTLFRLQSHSCANFLMLWGVEKNISIEVSKTAFHGTLLGGKCHRPYPMLWQRKARSKQKMTRYQVRHKSARASALKSIWSSFWVTV